jgi:hypothetical protein
VVRPRDWDINKLREHLKEGGALIIEHEEVTTEPNDRHYSFWDGVAYENGDWYYFGVNVEWPPKTHTTLNSKQMERIVDSSLEVYLLTPNN